MTSEVLAKFQASMDSLDKMIQQLETNLGQKHSVSPFVNLQKKYGAAPAKGASPTPAEETKKEEVKQEAPAKKEKKEKKANQPKGGKGQPAAAGPALSPEHEWFNACDLRVGKIVECEICPNSDKLYIEKIDLGEGQLREIGSGLR